MDATKTRIWQRSTLGLPQLTPEPPPRRDDRVTPPPLSAAGAITARTPTLRPQPLQATRVYPIEHLLPAARPPRRLARRFAGHALLALLTLLAVAAWQLPPLARGVRTRPLAARLPAQPAPSVSSVTEPRETLPPPGPAPGRAPGPGEPGLERRAVDLVIAGDYVAARRAYQALARERAAPVFDEAARILLDKERR
jgi:hypothetical protein